MWSTTGIGEIDNDEAGQVCKGEYDLGRDGVNHITKFFVVQKQVDKLSNFEIIDCDGWRTRKSNDQVRLDHSLQLYVPNGNPINGTSCEVGALEIRSDKDRIVQVCLAEVCLGEIGSTKISPNEFSRTQVCQPQTCPAEIGPGEIGGSEVGLRKIGPSKVSITEGRLAQISLREVCSDKVRLT